MRPFILSLICLLGVLGCQDQQSAHLDSEPDSLSVNSATNPTKEIKVLQSPNGYPSTEDWEYANQEQRSRAIRSFIELAKREVPVYQSPLFGEAQSEVDFQTPQEVARRALILWAVALRGEGIPKDEAIGLIVQLDLWPSVSPDEKRFLEDDDPDEELSRKMVWRHECVWVLMWALGYIDELDWPSGMCDVPRLVKLIEPFEADENFIKNAKLRDTSEILDARDLTMRIHWAIRDAHLNHGGMISADLDWSSEDYDGIHVQQSPAVGVVEQRHHTLNWLVKFLDEANWDDIDTPT